MTWRYNHSLDDWLTDGTTATIWCHNHNAVTADRSIWKN
jgi:hypothetical protein